MSGRALVATVVLLMGIMIPRLVEARAVHFFKCADCHRSGLGLTSLDNNVCLSCHLDTSGGVTLNDDTSVSAQGRFIKDDASNAMGSYQGTLSLQTSHYWASMTENVPAAGATNPVTNAIKLNGKYNLSRNKVICSRCHDPHLNKEDNPKLLKVINANDVLCRDCHRLWDEAANSGHGTHPMVADYEARAAALNTAATTAGKEPRFKTGVAGTLAGEMELVNGGVSCSTCHGTHFVDSDSATADGMLSAELGAGDGHLLRADGPTRADKSAICQSCHLYKRHGNPDKAQINVGCLVCHSGHSFNDDGPNPNYFVLRRDKVNPMDASAVPDQNYTALGTLLNDKNEFTQNGFCERCHGEAKNIPNHSIDRWLKDCRDCHGHNVASAKFSWQNDASVEVCGSCHGFPPYKDLNGNPSAGGTDGGYAYTDPSHNYDVAGYRKPENLTPHNSHAAGGLPQGAGTDYLLGTGQGACDPCHSGLANHRQDELAATYNATTFRDVSFGPVARGNMLYTINLNATYATSGNGSCTSVYCHSNGGKRTGDANKTSANFKFAPAAPAWGTGDADIIGVTSPNHECAYFCHGNSATTMASGAQAQYRDNSASHLKHVAKYACNVCHVQTATSATALAAGARLAPNGKHVNGKPDVAFDTAYDLDTVTGGTQALTFNPVGDNSSGYTSSSGTCAVYCHSNGGSTWSPLTYKSPDWDAGGSVVCGSCHGAKVGDATVIASGSHTRHVSDANGPTLACAECHVNAGSYTVAGGHADHINAAVNIDYARCTACHAVDGAETTPLWGQPSTMDCSTCHAGTRSTFELKTAPDKTMALTSGHNRPTASGNYPVPSDNLPANKSCTDCHDTKTKAGHFNGTLGEKLLRTDGGFPATYDAVSFCGACHGTSPVPAWAAPDRDIITHVSKPCTACHDPHGGGTNIFMIRPTSTGNYSGTVSFSSVTRTGTNSYDEDDGAAGNAGESNADDLCATCHTWGVSGEITGHNNKENLPTTNSHHQGENCMTSGCHKPHTEAAGAFKMGGGTLCSDCHGNPPTAADPRYASANGTTFGAHAKHYWKSTDDPAEDRTDCEICHPGAASYALGHTDGGALNLDARITVLGGGNYSCGTLNNDLGCHQSDSNDGFWKDTTDYAGDGLRCTACHNRSGVNDGVLANAATNTGSHTVHMNANKTCTNCHNGGFAINDTGHITNHLAPGPTNNDVDILIDRAKADLGEGTVDRPSTTYDQATLFTCSGGIGLGCHNSKTGPNWRTFTNIGCTDCHNPATSDAADPKTGLHNIGAAAEAAGVQKHDSTLTGGCTACHNSTKPGSHADGTWEDDSATNQSGGQPRFLKTGLVYGEGAANLSSCSDGVGTFLDACHSDDGTWKRRWSTEADSTATASGSARCNVCHGQYNNLTGSGGTGWNEGTSHYKTNGGALSTRGETHNSLGNENNVCEDCHVYTTQYLANHEDSFITMNDDIGVTNDTEVTVGALGVRCAYCHADDEDPAASGTYTFAVSYFTLERVAGANDPKAECNSCHGQGGGGRYWPVGPDTGGSDARNNDGRHEIHMARLAKTVYYPASATPVADLLADLNTKTRQIELCSYCHTNPGHASHWDADGGLPAEVDAIYNIWNKAADNGIYDAGADTCSNVNCHNNKLTLDNFYGWYDSTDGAGCVVCHTVGGANDLPNHNIHPNSGLHNITPAVSGVKHDDSFSVSGTCGSCHTGIVNAMVGGSHINGTAAADLANNTDRGLFNAYTDAAANTGTCAGSGVDNISNCHADGGAWNRRWSTTASVSDGATECLNCHGTFAGWRTVRTNHVDPYTGGDQTPAHDALGTAGEHPDCQICHGWGKPGYLTAWQNKTLGASPGHGDGRITMNGPSPSTGAGYNESTWGCAAACHSATWVMNDSSQTVNYGDYGGGSCFGCHGDGVSQYWPDGTPASPVYADNNANSAARHNTHILAISQYKWGETLAQLKTNTGNGTSDVKQKAVCAFCHGVNPGASGHNSDGGSDQRVDVANAGAFRKFTGSANDALDSGSGAYSLANKSCSNLVCHNLVTTPTVAADAWEGTTAANCTTLCHGPNTVATAREGHQKHVVTKAYACTQCHTDNTGNYQHINGTVTLTFTNLGSMEQAYGAATAASYIKGSFTYNRSTPNGTCTNVYCHADKGTPAWNGSIAATGCTACHTAGDAGTNPTSGLHNMTATNVQKHDGSQAPISGCTSCHVDLTSTPGSHINGNWEADQPSQAEGRFVSLTGYAEAAPNSSTCSGTSELSSCHDDGGNWSRLWSTEANVDIAASPDPGQLVCDVCHGQYQSLNASSKGWRAGTVHYRSGSGAAENKGSSHGSTDPLADKCEDCHAYDSAGRHQNGTITFSGNGSYNLAWGTNATTPGWYCTGCHNGTQGSQDDASSTNGHTYLDSLAFPSPTRATPEKIEYVSGGSSPEGGCTGCHGDAAGNFWPDTLSTDVGVWADREGSHLKHVNAIGEAIRVAASDPVLTIDHKNASCDYCHPGGFPYVVGVHNLDDAPLKIADVYQDGVNAGNFKHISGATDTNGAYNNGTKSCSNIDCHNNIATPGWNDFIAAPTAAPVTSSVLVNDGGAPADQITVVKGTNINATAAMLDTAGGSHTITAAECYFVPTTTPGSGTAMSLGAGTSSRTATKTLISTSGLTVGEHFLYVRGYDATDGWGAPRAARVTVVDRDTLTVTATDAPPPTNVYKGDRFAVAKLNLTANMVDDGEIKVNAIRVTLTGASIAYTDVASVAIYDNSGTTTSSWDANDMILGYATPSSLTVDVTNLQHLEVTNGTTTTLWVVYTLSKTAVTGHKVGASLTNTGVTVAAPDQVGAFSYSTTATATLTAIPANPGAKTYLVDANNGTNLGGGIITNSPCGTRYTTAVSKFKTLLNTSLACGSQSGVDQRKSFAPGTISFVTAFGPLYTNPTRVAGNGNATFNLNFKSAAGSANIRMYDYNPADGLMTELGYVTKTGIAALTSGDQTVSLSGLAGVVQAGHRLAFRVEAVNTALQNISIYWGTNTAGQRISLPVTESTYYGTATPSTTNVRAATAVGGPYSNPLTINQGAAIWVKADLTDPDGHAITGAQYRVDNGVDGAWVDIPTPDDGTYSSATEAVTIPLSGVVTGAWLAGEHEIAVRTRDNYDSGWGPASLCTVDVDVPGTLMVIGADIASPTVSKGQKYGFLKLAAYMGAGDTTLSSVAVTLTGTATPAEVAEAYVYLDDGDHLFNPVQDAMIGSAAVSGATTVIDVADTLIGLEEKIFYVALDIATDATENHTLGASITAGGLTIDAGDTVAGLPVASATPKIIYGMACGTCHPIPATVGKHAKHADGNADFSECHQCHGDNGGNSFSTSPTGYHNNGVKNLDTDGAAIGWTGFVTQTCTTAWCHKNFSTGLDQETPAWNNGGISCAFCHGYPPTAADGVDHTTFVKSDLNGFLWGHDDCRFCHGRTDDNNGKGYTTHPYYQPGFHGDGKVQMNGPAGIGSGYNDATGGCTVACHDAAAPYTMTGSARFGVEDVNFGEGCLGCHNSTVQAGSVWNAKGHAIETGETCKTCHDKHGGGNVTIANKPELGINFVKNGESGVALGSPFVPGSTEAEICWNCHANYRVRTATTIAFVDGGAGNDRITDSGNGLGAFRAGRTVTVAGSASNNGTYTILAVTKGAIDIPTGSLTGSAAAGPNVTVSDIITEWGVNADTNDTFPNYDAGQIYSDAGTTTLTANWLGAGTGAYWKSANFKYKTAQIQSTHAAGSGGVAGKDAVADLRCSYCHDVHDTKGPNGAPYLRGTWMGNPYREDGAPRWDAGGDQHSYAAGQMFGKVPRGNMGPNTTYASGPYPAQMGGYWIDQNSGSPALTLGKGINDVAGLCALCHDQDGNGIWNASEIESIDITTGGFVTNNWMDATANGHANSVLDGPGGSSSKARNVMNNAWRGINYTVTYGSETLWSRPYMGYYGITGSTRLYGTRNSDNGSGEPAADIAAGVYPFAYNPAQSKVNYTYDPAKGGEFEWGVSQDNTTIDSQYHQFTCSKCHNPHASRLPRLMITNCLDVRNNTWDDQYQGDTDWQSGKNSQVFSNNLQSNVYNPADGTTSLGTVKRNYGTADTDQLAYVKSAQNCHRAVGNTGVQRAGWNKITPPASPAGAW